MILLPSSFRMIKQELMDHVFSQRPRQRLDPGAIFDDQALIVTRMYAWRGRAVIN